MKKEQILFRDLFSLVGFLQGEDDMFLYVTAADAVDVVAQSERVNLMSELTFPQTRRCAAVGKGEYFRDTILDALFFEGETILEC